MTTHVVAPVKNILKSLEVGIKLAKRIVRVADSASRDQALQIFESADSLQKSLERSSRSISDAYEQSAEICGEPFARALLEDRSIQTQFKELRLDLVDHLDRCQDFDEEPDSFERSAFTRLDEQAKICRDGCLLTFHDLRDQYCRNLQAYRLRTRAVEENPQSPHARQQADQRLRGHFPSSPDDIAYSRAASNVASHIENMPAKPESADKSTANVVPMLPTSTWAFRTVSPPRPHTGATSPPYGVSPSTRMPHTEFMKTAFSVADAKPLPLIPREARYSQGNTGHELSESKQQSDLLFQGELRELSAYSPTSIYSPASLWSPATPATMYSPIEDRFVEANRVSDLFSELSIPENSVASGDIHSRLSGSSLDGYHSLVTNQLSRGHFSQSTCSSAMSSIDVDLYAHSQDKTYSDPHENSLVSPKVSRRVSDSFDSWAALSKPSASGQQGYEPTTSFDHRPTSSQFQSGKNKSDDINDWVPALQAHLHKTKTRDITSTSEYSSPVGIPEYARRTSGNIGSWGPTSLTIHTVGYGAMIESGLEVVMDIDHDNEKMVVSQEEMPHFVQPIPPVSTKSTDCSITQDASFYRFGGFCDGAQYMLKGETGFKVVKRPSGHYSATVSARCVKCSYEVGWNDVEKDRLLSRDGIYGNSGIRWRQRFLSKCHLKTGSIEEPMYACIFCVEEHQTVEENDATVFFSVSHLFRHLAKHTRPLPDVYGITTIYGRQSPDVVDFDVHFTTPDPQISQFSISEIATKVASRASAQASSTHNPKPTGRNARDPDGQYSLHFAVGAKIVGIAFPDRFAGQWCTGYHDGERGSFPAEKITLQMPAKEDVLMNSRSSLTAIAKWDFKPRDAKDGGWLKFNKGDRLTCIGYTFFDEWCWSGQTSKGKWGLFPSSFVKELKDSTLVPETRPHTARSTSSKSSGFGTLIGMGRNKSKHERNGSLRSVSSVGSGNMPMSITGRNLVCGQGE